MRKPRACSPASQGLKTNSVTASMAGGREFVRAHLIQLCEATAHAVVGIIVCRPAVTGEPELLVTLNAGAISNHDAGDSAGHASSVANQRQHSLRNLFTINVT